MRTCFGYIRVSTQKQGEGVSLQAQKEAIQAYAAANGLSVARWFEEKQTAAKSGRAVFNQMLKLLRRGEADGLIMHKIDRSARNLKDWAIVTELPDEGIDVFVATESLDFRSRGGRLTADIQAVIAADYVRNLREETKKGLNGRLKQGLYPFRAPIGYVDNGRGQAKTPCPIKAPLIAEAFDLYASGRHSLRTLRIEMRKRGLRNHHNQPLTLHGIETVLGNLFYTGVIEIRRTGALYDGVHEPLIDTRTFTTVQDIRAGRAGKKTTKHNHLYRGLFRCGLCEGAMSPERQKGHVYYRCQRRDCPTTSIREDLIEDKVLQCFSCMELNEDQASELLAGWTRWLHGDERFAKIRSIELRIEEAVEKLDRAVDLMIAGSLDPETFNDRKRRLVLERETLRQDLAETQKIDLPPDDLRKFTELLKSLTGLYEIAKPAEKRFLVENCFSNRMVVGKDVELEPLNWLRNPDLAEVSPLVTRIATVLEPLQAERLKLLASKKS